MFMITSLGLGQKEGDCVYYSKHRKMRAKQQHVCKEMNMYEQYQPEVVFKFQHRMYNRSESPEIAY